MMSWPSSSTVSEAMMRRRAFVVASYSQMFQVGWSSSSAPSMNWARIANTTLLPSKFTSRSRMSPRPSVWLAVRLISGAETEARSRMNRSAPISKRRSSRASSSPCRRLPDRGPGASRRTPGSRASPDPGSGRCRSSRRCRRCRCCSAASTLHAARSRARLAPRTARCGCDCSCVLTFRLITHCVLQNDASAA